MGETQKRPAVVLVVEDEFLTRFAALTALDHAGFDVLDAENAEAALRVLAERSDVRVLFTDINMPGRLDGLELAFEVRRSRPSIGLILTSGKARPNELQMLGGARFLSKPYTELELLAGVEALMLLRPSPSPIALSADRGIGRPARFLAHRRHRW
jgi:two-component system, response regulator PdtaR